MNKTFKRHTLGLAIASAVLLAGCNTETAQTEQQSQVAPAQVSLSVKFPESDVAPAWIGDSQEIQVSFYNTQYLGSYTEAIDGLQALSDCSANKPDSGYQPDFVEVGEQDLTCSEIEGVGTRGQLATTAYLNSTNPKAAIQLNPGKYRVEAAFFDESSKLQETSVSYVTLSEGSHSLKLRGIEATWTATTPLKLQLLNQQTSVDWDSEQAGIQTPADVMGISGDINGLHLPSALTYPDSLAYNNEWQVNQLNWADDGARINVGFNRDQWFEGENYTGFQTDELTDRQMSTLFQPIIRVAGDNGEINLTPRFDARVKSVEITSDEHPWNYTWSEETQTILAFLNQEYTTDGDRYGLSLGGIRTTAGHLDEAEQTFNYYYSYLEFGVQDASEDEEDSKPYHISWYPEYTYWDADKGTSVKYENLTIASISSQFKTGGDWQSIFLSLQGNQNQITDGKTITGSLMEIISSHSSDLETHGQALVKPTPYLDASLNAIAVEAGLLAAPASNCQTFENTYTNFSNEYLWDEGNQRWVAGTFNQLVGLGDFDILAQINSKREEVNQYHTGDEAEAILADLDAAEVELLELADFNKDGTATLFEEGVFIDSGMGYPYCNLSGTYDYDLGRTVYSLDCSEFTVTDTISGWSQTETTTLCVQPFELKATQLAMDLDTDAEIGIE